VKTSNRRETRGKVEKKNLNNTKRKEKKGKGKFKKRKWEMAERGPGRVRQKKYYLHKRGALDREKETPIQGNSMGRCQPAKNSARPLSLIKVSRKNSKEDRKKQGCQTVREVEKNQTVDWSGRKGGKVGMWGERIRTLFIKSPQEGEAAREIRKKT